MKTAPSAEPALGLYLHLPFCRERCNYCAFAISTRGDLDDVYTDALLKEIEERAGGERLETIYLGGGTPSRTSPENLERIITTVSRVFDTSSARELTMEVNPEDVTRQSIDRWRTFGVDRFSIGVQSFHDRELAAVNRQHGSATAREAIELLSLYDVRLSLDLIAGLPSQSDDSFLGSLRQAASSSVGHISIYMLDLEPGSLLTSLAAKGLAELPADDDVAERYRILVETLEHHGLMQYEVSNFAVPGEESLHNLRYWNRRPYLGLGLGAHSFDGTRRWANTRNMRHYLSATNEAERTSFEEVLSESEIREEELMLGLRRKEGFSNEYFTRVEGEKGETWRRRCLENGWVREDRVAFTTEGFILSDELITELF